MNDNTFTVKADPNGKAKFRITIPVQYCTDEIFKNLSLTFKGSTNKNIEVKKSNLQFEVELEESPGVSVYSLVLKNNADQVDSKEITINVIPGEGQQDSDPVLSFRETFSLLENGKTLSLSSVFINEADNILLAGEYRNLKLYNKSSLELKSNLEGHSESIKCIEFDESKNTFLSMGSDKIIRWSIDLSSPVEIICDPPFKTGYGYNRNLDLFFYNKNLYYVFSGANDSFFEVFNIYDKDDTIKIEKKVNHSPSKVKFDPENEYLFFGSTPENSIKVFSLRDKKMIQDKIMLESGIIDNITILPGGKYFLSHYQGSDHFKIWSLGEWVLLRKEPIRKVQNSGDLIDVILDNNKSELTIIYKSGTIDIYDWHGISD